MSNIILGILITLILISIPSYLLSSFLSFKKYFVDRIYVGYSISMSIIILIGYLLSYFKVFKIQIFAVILLLYNILSISLFLYFKRDINIDYKKIINFLYIDKTSLIIILLLLITFYTSLYYTNLSPFPLGSDRGKHFSRSIMSINMETLEKNHPGSNYKVFYFQGPNIIISILSGASLFFANNCRIFSINNFDLSVELSIAFKFFFNLIISSSILSMFFLSIYIYEKREIGIYSSIIMCSLLGLFGDVGSIGSVISFLYINIFLIIFNKYDLTYFDYVIYSLSIISIFSIHIIGIFYMFLLLFLLLIWKLFNKENINIYNKILYFIISTSFILIYIFLTYPSFIEGVLSEIMRKGVPIIDNTPAASLNYLIKNINILRDNIIYISIPIILSVFGIINDIFKKRTITIPLLINSLIFILIPITNLIKTLHFVIYPLSLLSGLGLFCITNKINKKLIKVKIMLSGLVLLFITKRVNKILITILLIIYLSIFTMFSVINLRKLGSQRLYHDYDSYKELYDLSQWLENEVDPSNTILFPSSGSSAFFLSAFCIQKILFSDPRFPDIPSFMETSMIYNKFPTNKGTFDYSSISSHERYNIIRKYNISAIITLRTKSYLNVDIESIEKHFASINLYYPTENYGIIILEEK